MPASKFVRCIPRVAEAEDAAIVDAGDSGADHIPQTPSRRRRHDRVWHGIVEPENSTVVAGSTDPHPSADQGKGCPDLPDAKWLADIHADHDKRQPVAASFLSADWNPDGHYSFALETLICLPGEEGKFYEAVDRLLPKGITSVTYNGRGFDMPVLQLGAMAAGRFELEGLSAQTHAHRYGSTHCDLADQFSGYGGTRRVPLAELCDTLGIPVKTAAHGSDVGALWQAGDIEAIVRYVEEDVIATYIVWLHWAAARANEEQRIAVPLADLARWLERTPRLIHLMPFATCRPAMWARPTALLHSVGRALADAERRVQQAADERAFAGERPIL